LSSDWKILSPHERRYSKISTSIRAAKAMAENGWSIAEFREIFGKNYLD
jgi:hypothetical protein